MFSINLSKTGTPFLSYQGKALQSTYRPEKEAQSWAQEQGGDEKICIVLGDPLGYASQALLNKGNNKKVLSLGFTEEKATQASYWFPKMGSLKQFIRKHIHLEDFSSVQLLSWPRSTQLTKNILDLWSTEIRAVFREIQGSIFQIRYFGPRIIRNLLRFDEFLSSHTKIMPSSSPALLLASGPSLRENKDFILNHQNQFEIWALSSALNTLDSWGVKPQVVLTLDPGFNAVFHLRRIPSKQLVMTPPSGVFHHSMKEKNLSLYSTGSPLEECFFISKNIKAPILPSKGTVALTALDALLNQLGKTIYIFGFDLAFSGLLSHSHPHTWTGIYEPLSDRTSPYLQFHFHQRLNSATVSKPQGIRTSPAMETYALYLETKKPYPEQRVFRVQGKNSFPLKQIENINVQDIPIENKLQPLSREFQPMEKGTFRKMLLNTKDPIILKELGQMLGDEEYWRNPKGEQWIPGVMKKLKVWTNYYER